MENWRQNPSNDFEQQIKMQVSKKKIKITME